MMKWIKNTYYMWMNRWYTHLIHDATIDYKSGHIGSYYYNLITKKYKSKIMDNLGKIRL